MVQELVHDPILLGRRSEVAGPEDLQVAVDLLDTLAAHRDTCVGMAANMIGVQKRIIVFVNEGSYMTMFNPEIVKVSGPYSTEEGCLSLPGRWGITKRPKHVTVRAMNRKGEWFEISGSGSSAKTITADSEVYCYFMVTIGNEVDETVFVQLEVGSTASSYEEYVPITETDISFPSPVYGGEHEAVSGRLSSEWAEIASYNGETLSGEWMSDRDVYSAGTTPTIGAQVVYKLATPQEITLITEQITALKGENTIWSDADGSLTAVYLVSAAYADSHPVGGLGSGLLGFGSGNPDHDEPGEHDDDNEQPEDDQTEEP